MHNKSHETSHTQIALWVFSNGGLWCKTTNSIDVNFVDDDVKTSILTHSQHPHCLTSKRIQFPTTVSRLCPIIKLAHLLFGTRKIPIHAYPRLCIVLSCTTLLKAVYRGGKTTLTTNGGYNEFRNDDEPNTTKRRRVLAQILVFMMFAFICFVAITYERKAGILAGLPQSDCCCSQSNLARYTSDSADKGTTKSGIHLKRVAQTRNSVVLNSLSCVLSGTFLNIRYSQEVATTRGGRWPICDSLIAFHSSRYLLEKAKTYVALKKSYL
ncbi:inositol hexakisphosphate and diphosphoinositol-pentakisphosphate kinase VIP2-like protein isoform X2 [Tanacetum coccineum]|uniref:Inositol hexakisphosphate and diphosphoinositol-pentakisphosphate kinase VIP2-like protein isoform X2 n=1 Tax=Tanacetum coccineum TaxID=301880 RepID=A0ABQ5DI24_9ASTR